MKEIKQTYVGVDKKDKLYYYNGETYIPVLDETGGGGDIELKTINGQSIKGSGNISITTYQAFPNDWPTESKYTTKQFCDVVDADAAAVIGMGYFGGAKWSDKPAGLANGDVVVEILEGPNHTKAIHLIMTSSTVAPYRWEYTYWSHGSVSGWRGVQPELISGTNIKTINNQSLLGSGNITIEGGGSEAVDLDFVLSDFYEALQLGIEPGSQEAVYIYSSLVNLAQAGYDLIYGTTLFKTSDDILIRIYGFDAESTNVNIDFEILNNYLDGFGSNNKNEYNIINFGVYIENEQLELEQDVPIITLQYCKAVPHIYNYLLANVQLIPDEGFFPGAEFEEPNTDLMMLIGQDGDPETVYCSVEGVLFSILPLPDSQDPTSTGVAIQLYENDTINWTEGVASIKEGIANGIPTVVEYTIEFIKDLPTITGIRDIYVKKLTSLSEEPGPSPEPTDEDDGVELLQYVTSITQTHSTNILIPLKEVIIKPKSGSGPDPDPVKIDLHPNYLSNTDYIMFNIYSDTAAHAAWGQLDITNQDDSKIFYYDMMEPSYAADEGKPSVSHWSFGIRLTEVDDGSNTREIGFNDIEPLTMVITEVLPL